MKLARWTFRGAGIYGLLVLLPQYFREPPELAHPVYFYGFLGVALAWQVVFLLVGFDPVRFRPIMLAGVVEKVSFGLATSVLFTESRISESLFAAGLIDLGLGVLFVIAWFSLRDRKVS